MSTVLNRSYLSKPVSVAQGGTSNASNATAYDLLTAGTTSTAALQVSGLGTAGQFYVSGGNAALGTYTAANKTGCWQLIATASPSAVANVAFTGLATSYEAYILYISAMLPATNTQALNIVFSSNNGSGYDTGAGNYAFVQLVLAAGGSVANTHNSSATNIILANGVTNTTSVGANCVVYFFEPAVSQVQNSIIYASEFNVAPSFTFGMGQRLATQVNNAFRLQFASGNITSGTLELYGLLT